MHFNTLEKWDVTAERNEYNEIECYRMMYLGWTIGFYNTLEEAEQAGRDFKPCENDARFKAV